MQSLCCALNHDLIWSRVRPHRVAVAMQLQPRLIFVGSFAMPTTTVSRTGIQGFTDAVFPTISISFSHTNTHISAIVQCKEIQEEKLCTRDADDRPR